MANLHRKPDSGQTASAGSGGAPIAPSGATSRRSALLAALGGASIVALPAVAHAASEPDKILRWHGEQLEVEYAAYQLAVRAFYAAAEAIGGEWYAGVAFYRGEMERGDPRGVGRLFRAKEDRWATVTIRAARIRNQPVATLAGLAVKARALELEAFGIATTRCSHFGIELTEAQTGWWPSWQMRQFAAEVAAVAGAA